MEKKKKDSNACFQSAKCKKRSHDQKKIKIK